MSYIRAKLAGTPEAIIADIKTLQLDGAPVYPNFPEGYEKRVDDNVFIVSDIAKEITDPGDEETLPTLSEDHYCYLVLPAGYDTAHLNTLAND